MKKIIALVVLSLGTNASSADSAVDTQFVGTWVLQEIQDRTEGNEWVESDLLGKNPFGILMYDEFGNMAVQIARRERSVPAEEEAVKEIVNGYVAYTASYEVDESTSTVTHHRTSHINPDLGHLSVVRFYEFDGETLTLTIAPDRQRRLKWLRSKSK